MSTPPLLKKTSQMLVRVLGFAGEYEGAHAEEAKEYVRKRVEDDLENITADSAFQLACQLQLSDVKNIWQNDAKFMVLPPQSYGTVLTLDRSDDRFQWACDGEAEKDPEFTGCFHGTGYDDTAVTGSGSDVWYKVTPTLVDWAAAVDEEARALASADDVVVDDLIVQTLENSMQEAEKERNDVLEELRRLDIVRTALQDRVKQQGKDVDDTRVKIARRKARLLREKATGKRAKH